MRALVLLVVVAAAAAIAGCGLWGDEGPPDENDVLVQLMPWDGQTVGFAILSVSDESDWRGYAWLADVLLEDSDPDRPKRIAVHELEHIRAWDEHGPFADSEDLPATFDERWYLAEADAKAPFTPIPEDELAWLASWRRLDVFVAAAGDLEREWLAMVLAEACDFVNDSAGEEVFRYGGIAGLED